MASEAKFEPNQVHPGILRRDRPEVVANPLGCEDNRLFDQLANQRLPSVNKLLNQHESFLTWPASLLRFKINFTARKSTMFPNLFFGFDSE